MTIADGFSRLDGDGEETKPINKSIEERMQLDKKAKEKISKTQIKNGKPPQSSATATPQGPGVAASSFYPKLPRPRAISFFGTPSISGLKPALDHLIHLREPDPEDLRQDLLGRLEFQRF
jgi:hypothetical protein